jgi:hypothetical protein
MATNPNILSGFQAKRKTMQNRLPNSMKPVFGSNQWMKKMSLLKLTGLLVLLTFLSTSSFSQIQLITSSDGGFENGTSSFAANGWTPVQPGNTRQWQVGTAAGSVSGGSKSAYMGTSSNYNGNNNNSVQHFYRDVAVPSGATNVQFQFYLRRGTVDAGDNFYVFTTTTSNTPVSGTVPTTGYTTIYNDQTTTYSNFTQMTAVNLSSWAGSTVRLVFTFQSDGSNPHATPAVDNVTLSYNLNPIISGFSPSSVCAGSSVTISGSNLSGATAVTIGGTAVSSITSNTASEIIAVVGSGTTGVISVTTAGGSGSSGSSVTVNSLPTAFNMTGGGTGCSSGSGIAVGLSGSQTGVNYQLYRGGVATGSPLAGTGAAISFGNQTVSGAYTVIATNATTGCTRNQTGTSTVTINTAPSISAQPTTQAVCVGTSVTFSVTAAGSPLSYQWRKNGSNIGGATSSSYTIASPVSGDAGNYDVVLSVTGCSNLTSSTAVLTVNALPTQYNVTGGGTGCSTAGVAVGVSNSQTGVSYQLYRAGVATGSPVAGTGAAISFGNQFTSGNYTVIGTNTTTGCTRTQNGSVNVTINTAPSISVQPVSQAVCAGTSVTFSVTGSGTSVTYQWRKNGSNIGGATSSSYTISNPAAGDAGNYDVVLSVSSCSSLTSSTATLTVNALPTANNMTGSGTACSTAGQVVGLNGSQTGVNYQLYIGGVATGSPVSGTGSALSFGAQFVSGTYTAIATNATTGCVRNQNAQANVTINTAPSISVQPVSQTKCLGSSVTFSVTASGTSVTYQWRKNGTNIAGATSSSYTIASIVAGDVANYDVVLSVASCSNLTSNVATLSLTSAPTAYNVTGGGSYCNGDAGVVVGLSGSQSGVNYTLSPGGTVVAGTGSAISFGYQTLASVYTAVGSNGVGCNTNMTGSATVTMNDVPLISTQPVDANVCTGGTATFTVTASGGTLTYQWRKGTTNLTNGGNISGATSATLTISSVSATDAATDYNCVITNLCGPEVTDYVDLTVSTSATTPSAQPTSLTFPTIGATSIIGSFTASASASAYLVVRTSTILPPSNPIDGTTYAVGSTALGAGSYVEYSGTSTSFTSNGLNQGTTYYYWIFAYNTSICGTSPRYYTTSPLNGSATTTTNISCVGNPTYYWAGSGSSYSNPSKTDNMNTASNWSTSSTLYVAALTAPTGCTNVIINLTSTQTIRLSSSLSVYNLELYASNAAIGALNTNGRTLTINGNANIDVPTGSANNSSYVIIGEVSTSGAGIVDFKGNVTIGVNTAAFADDKASFFYGNNNSKLIFRADLILGRTCVINSAANPGTIEFDGAALQQVLWNNDMYFANFRNVVVGNTNSPIVRHVTGTYTPDNILGNLTVNNASVLDLATSQWIRDNAGGTFALNGTSRLILGNNQSIPSPSSGNGIVVPGSNFPGGFTTNTISSNSTVEYDGADGITQTVYNGVTYGNLVLSSETGVNTANKITTGAVTVTNSTTVNGYTKFTLGGNFTSNGAMSVESGAEVDASTYTIGGSGSFTLKAGATLDIGSLLGITSSGATGNVQTTTRSFSTGANYVYVSTAGAGVTGNGLPTTMNNLTINNTSGVTLFAGSTTYTVSNILRLTSGAFAINGNTLAVNNVVRTSGTFSSNANSSLTISGTNVPLNFTAGFRFIKNLTLNTNATASLNTDLDVAGGSAFGTVSIGSGATLTTNNRLTLRSNATGTARVAEIPSNPSTGAALGFITGNVTVERYLQAQRAWRLLAAPTAGSQTIKAAWQENQAQGSTSLSGRGFQISGETYPSNGFDMLSSVPSVKVWNMATSNYTGISSTLNPIANDYGYMAFVRGDRTINYVTTSSTATILRSSGTLKTGKYPSSAIPVDAGKFQSVANPYASAIDFSKVTRTGGVPNTFYVWDPKLTSGGGSSYGFGGFRTITWDAGSGSYIVTPSGGSYTSNTNIESGSAFFVMAPTTAGTVQFTEACKVSGSNLVNRPGSGTDSKQIRLDLYTNSGADTILLDGTLVQFDNNNFNGIDDDDAVKLNNTGENIGIARLGKFYIVERRAEVVSEDTIQYNLGQMKARTYRLQIDANNLADSGLTAFLEDNFLQTRTALALDDITNYSFSVTGSAAGSFAANRFRIVFKNLNAPAPFAFTNISASKITNAQNRINWQVANERSIRRYELQRSSDGSNFSTIQFVDPSSNVGNNPAYVNFDNAPLASANYYRIKAVVAATNEILYSNIARVVPTRTPNAGSSKGTEESTEDVLTDATKGNASVYPNPVQNKTIHLVWGKQDAGKYEIRLYSTEGKTMYRNSVNLTNDIYASNFILDASVPAGQYQLEIRSASGLHQTISVLIP